MKLRALEIEQFRKFDRPVRIEGFGDHINVLSGPNEFGKSTILAAIRSLMFERHNSTAAQIKRMQNWRGNAAPVLAMDFETGAGAWRIEKRFLSKPMARLTGPDGGRFDNDAAEEELQLLLGFAASGKQGAKPENMGVWGALWVTQRDSVLQADLSQGIARSTITSCLDAEVGVLTGTESGQALLRAVREERGRFLDGNGKPRDRYKAVLTELEAVTVRLADLQVRAERLAEDAAALRTANEKLTRESDPGVEQRDRAALEEARRLHVAAMLYAEKLARVQSARDLARQQADDARREHTARQTRAAQLAASQIALRGEQQKLLDAQADEDCAEGAYVAARQRADAAQEEAAATATSARRLRSVADLVRRSASLAKWQEALQKAEAEQEKLSGLQARAEAMPMTPARIEAIRKAARERDTAEALLTTQATQLAIDLLPGAVARVQICGAPLAAARVSRPVVDETDIAIEGVGVVRITPAIQDREKFNRRIDKARDALSVALIAGGCATAAGAEEAFAEREHLLRGLAGSQAALERLVPGDAAASLAPGVAPLRDHVTLVAKRTAQEMATLGLAALPELAQAGAHAVAADAAEIAAAEALRQARAESDIAGDRGRATRDATAQLAGRVKTAEAEHARLELETTQAEARESGAALAARLDTARTAHEIRAAEAAALETEHPEHTVDGMAARIQRYEAALIQRGNTVRALRESITVLRTRIAQEGGHGLDEQIAAAERERDKLQLEQAAGARDVKILNLLLGTLTSAEHETKERYLAPVVRRVTPYLRSLFPAADITCDDALRITGVTRGMLGAEDFDRLSDGTQEQIAVLSRLAFAEMLTDQGNPAMVILDDALAYSDAERMERMFDILTQASAKTQILVLTCREDLFSRLGGNRLELTHGHAPVV